jgi:hypothetical protein
MRSLLLVTLLAVPAFAQGSIFPDQATKDAARKFDPENVSEASRAFLKSKMKSHIKDMKELSIAVATIQAAEVQRLAQGIANQPRLDKNTAQANQLPPRFFELQDELKKNAQALSDAGKANSMDGMLNGYQNMVSTCMQCHAAFKAQVVQAGDKK